MNHVNDLSMRLILVFIFNHIGVIIDYRKEMLVACKRKLAIIEFSNNDEFKCFTSFGTDKYFDKGVSSFGVEVLPHCWHTVISLEPMSVLLEVKKGLFKPKACKECAP